MKRIKNFILFICSIVFIVIGAVLLMAIYWLIKTALLIFCEQNM